MIQAENLTKVYKIPEKDPGVAGAVKALFRPRYKAKPAVTDVSFTVEPGEIVGYIGVNGAGKSTTIKMLTGILVPTAGQVRVLGRDPHRDRVANARDIGVVFGQRTQLWWDLALIESLTMVGRIYEVPDARFKQLMDEFAETLELKELLKIPIRNMSLGQKMRAELAATLIHEPRIVYLDEPTIGLDLLVKERIRAFIKRVNQENGTTVILTTHDLGDIEELCKRVLIIDNGALIYDGPLATIKDRFGKYREITFETAADLNGLALPDGAELLEKEERKLSLRFDRTQTSASRVSAAIMSQIEVLDLSLKEPDLSMIVKQIYLGGLKNDKPGVESSPVISQAI
ncbi:ABC transporter related [Candidatus Promineifilum breve]|uniref:ABC transporter related n=1 Tax=Candidatus Promineifilum breve TaxID=1806508 RepID=A0A160T269_9CHLR|nr:ATP-binding cassette domain-containing protein [Candidatus Promineifilum breve]CUS02510.1 ABC transporter related [Candidatus Promineifilum breve]